MGMGGSRRHIGIGLAAALAIMFGGGFLFRDSGDTAMQVVAMVGFLTFYIVFHSLDERAKRRDKNRAQ
jgi:hypothetical protein